MERLDWIGKGRERTGRDRREEDEEAMIPMAEDFFRAQGQKVWLDACEWAFGAFCLDFWAAIRRGLIPLDQETVSMEFGCTTTSSHVYARFL